jgi:2-polyprenyl-3-methyl-5-hydroxy-6-metoxy-1,4-benzoquinol methylase
MIKQPISCNVCGADDYIKLSSVGEWSIGKCAKCELVYVNPAPFFEPTPEFSQLSKDFQYTQYMHQTITPEILQHETLQLLGHLREITRLTGQILQTPRYLEVGCGSGASVRAATDLGWHATGIDIDPELIEVGRRQLQVDLRCTPLLKSGLPEGAFNFVRLRDVIEHLPDPYDNLVMIRQLLAPGGVALFVTPNEDGLPTKMRLLFGGIRDRVATVPPPHHLHGFTPQTLNRLLDRAGFRCLSGKTTTPVDPKYVTSNNMRSRHNPAYVALWQGARALGKGSMVVSWVSRP